MWLLPIITNLTSIIITGSADPTFNVTGPSLAKIYSIEYQKPAVKISYFLPCNASFLSLTQSKIQKEGKDVLLVGVVLNQNTETECDINFPSYRIEQVSFNPPTEVESEKSIQPLHNAARYHRHNHGFVVSFVENFEIYDESRRVKEKWFEENFKSSLQASESRDPSNQDIGENVKVLFLLSSLSKTDLQQLISENENVLAVREFKEDERFK